MRDRAQAQDLKTRQTRYQRVGLALGPIAFIVLLLAPPPDGMAIEAWRVAAVGILMAVWWAT